MAELFFIKSPEDFNKSIVPANKILAFVGLSEDGVPTPFYKLPDGSIVQLYQALLDALKGTVVPSSGSGLSYITVESVINNEVIVPGIPASVLLNGTYYTIQDTYVRPIAGETNWLLDITKILALANMPEFSGQLTVFYNAVDFVYVDVALNTPLTLTAEEAGSTVKLIASDFPTTSGLQYRVDTDVEFTPYTVGTEIKLNNVGDYVQFYNTKETLSTYTSTYVQFVMTGKIAASGNIQSMLNYSNNCSDYCYNHLFYKCTSLTKAPELPTTTLAKGCYSYMFSGCTSLTQAPELPATTLADYCYNRMFSYCTSLTKTPELPTTTLTKNCYSGMFEGCTALTQVPELPAIELADSCYSNMFAYCTSLTKAPELPATTLAPSCYSRMFEGCTALTQVPELPATALVDGCYYQMLYGCSKPSYISVNFTEWHSTATTHWVLNAASSGTFKCPAELPEEYGNSRIPEGWTVVRKEDYSYDGLTLTAEEAGSTVKLTANGSPTTSGLQYRTSTDSSFTAYSVDTEITLTNVGDYVQFKNTEDTLSTNSDNYVQFVMTGKIAASGNIQSMLNNRANCVRHCYGRMFSQCTSLTQAPELPATTLANDCYYNMFVGCTSLTEAPELPATTLTSGCYFAMFEDCTSLTRAPELPATTLVDYCYQRMFEGCSKLTYINVGFTAWHNDTTATVRIATADWVHNVASSGTFVAPAELPDERGGSRIPEGWTLTTNEAESFTITGVDTNPEVNGTYVPVEDEE